MTTKPIPTDRTLFARWLLLLGFAVVVMFFAALTLFSFLPGVDRAAVFAPVAGMWGNLWQYLAMMGAAAMVGMLVYAIAPALRAYWHPDRKAERELYAAAIAERNTALAERDAAARLAVDAEHQLIEAREKVERLGGAIVAEYTELYNSPSLAGLTVQGMLAAMRSEILLMRPRLERTETIVRERDDLRTKLAEALNRPVPAPVGWVDLLPLVEYGATGNITVKAVRDVLRKVTPIPEGEYAAFSAAVRQLSAYSPAKRGAKPIEVLTVSREIFTSNPAPDGRNTPVTDGRIRSRTPRTQRTKRLPTARARGKVEVEV